MPLDLPLAMQTQYAELLEQTASEAFEEAFAEDGSFVAKTIRGRRYWYFQTSTKEGRRQRYAGPETPELLDRIRSHRSDRTHRRDRRMLVSTLVRAGHLPRPRPQIGDTIAALAKAGVFRLRGVLVGTMAYQTYGAALGVRLAGVGLETEDVDVAQFGPISVAIDDKISPVLDVLRSADPTFRPVSEQTDNRRTTKYQAKSGIRVDFLTPNRGPDTDEAATLPAFQTDAAQLRFLDFLIREPEPAVVLHETGIYVSVPSPQRYAIHKLIVARRRRQGAAKSDKDLYQAAALLEVLARKRPYDLKAAWEEAYGRDPKWRKLIGEGLGLVPSGVRDVTLKVVGMPRSVVEGLDLAFASPPVRYDLDRDVVTFRGEAGGELVRCAISREALDDLFGLRNATDKERMDLFRANRSLFERMLRVKYLDWPIDSLDEVLIKALDLEKLETQIKPALVPASPKARKPRAR